MNVNELHKEATLLWKEGKKEQSIDRHNEILAIYKSINDIDNIINILKPIGFRYDYIGNFKLALDAFEQSYNYSKQIKNLDQEAHSLHNMRGLHLKRGNSDKSLEYFLKSFELRKTLNRQGPIAYSLHNIGKAYFQKNENDLAIKYYKKALEIRKKIILGSKSERKVISSSRSFDYSIRDLAQSYFDIAIYFFEINNLKESNYYLKMLEEIEIGNHLEYEVILIYKKILGGLFLKNEEKLESIVKAIKIFRDISNNQKIKHRFQIFAIKNLLELLIIEFKVTKSQNVFQEISNQTTRLFDIAKIQNSPLLTTESLILQSKLALVNGKVQLALDKLSEAELLVENSDLIYLIKQLKKEKEKINNEINRWQLLSNENKELIKKIEETDLEDYLQGIQKLKSTFSDFENINEDKESLS